MGVQVERLELRDITADEMVKRLRLVEQEVQDLSSSKLSPFNQQDIISRLDDMEVRVSSNNPGSGAALPRVASSAVSGWRACHHEPSVFFRGDISPTFVM